MFDFSVEQGERLTIQCTIQNPESLVYIENGSLVLTKEGINLTRKLGLCLLINSYVSYIHVSCLIGVVFFYSRPHQNIMYTLSYSFFKHTTLRDMAQGNFNGRWFRCIHLFIHDLSRSCVGVVLCHCHCTRSIAFYSSIYIQYIHFLEHFLGWLSKWQSHMLIHPNSIT